jgi:hypothetical protein
MFSRGAKSPTPGALRSKVSASGRNTRMMEGGKKLCGVATLSLSFFPRL